ncbi:hypothetical protein QR680_011666 [Steinernema hermaphroditum]|uniref:Uncharacterized protein n=1 Tax=Steinernema hermaphroditum TaxID=289476 RepID=A0AA39HZA6_9BILA|nr:hypothetical protein QR680_011666 [Steinernema hermaphroditum]
MSSNKHELDEEELLLGEPCGTVDLGDIDEDALFNDHFDLKSTDRKCDLTEEELLFSDDDLDHHKLAPAAVDHSFSKDDELDYDEDIILDAASVKEEPPKEEPIVEEPPKDAEVIKDEKKEEKPSNQRQRIKAPSPLPEDKPQHRDGHCSSSNKSAPPRDSRPRHGPKIHVNPNFQGRNVVRGPMPVGPPPIVGNPVLNVANSIIQSQLASMAGMAHLRPSGPVPLMSLRPSPNQPPPRPQVYLRPAIPQNQGYSMGVPGMQPPMQQVRLSLPPQPQPPMGAPFGGPIMQRPPYVTGPPPSGPALGPPPGPAPSSVRHNWNDDVNQFLMRMNQSNAMSQPTSMPMLPERSRSPRRSSRNRRHRDTRRRSSRRRARHSSSRSRSRSPSRSMSSSRSYSRSVSSYSSLSRSPSRSRSPRERSYRSQLPMGSQQPDRDPGGYMPKGRRSGDRGSRGGNSNRDPDMDCVKAIGLDHDYMSKLEEQKRLREQMLRKKEQRRNENRGSPGPSKVSRRDPPPQDPLPTDDKKRTGRSKAYLVVVVDNVERWPAAQPTIQAIASATGRIKKCWQSASSTVSIVFHEHDNAKQFMMNQNGKVYGGCRLAIRLEKAYLNLATV